MARNLGATDAFNSIVQKIDEAFIQAEAHLRSVRIETESNKSGRSTPEATVVPSVASHRGATNSERSCSPSDSCASSMSGVTKSASSTSSRSGRAHRVTGVSSTTSVRDIHVKSKSYVAFDKKKAIVLTSFKSSVEIEEAEVKKIQNMIDQLFKKSASTSSSSASSVSAYLNL